MKEKKLSSSEIKARISFEFVLDELQVKKKSTFPLHTSTLQFVPSPLSFETLLRRISQELKPHRAHSLHLQGRSKGGRLNSRRTGRRSQIRCFPPHVRLSHGWVCSDILQDLKGEG